MFQRYIYTTYSALLPLDYEISRSLLLVHVDASSVPFHFPWFRSQGLRGKVFQGELHLALQFLWTQQSTPPNPQGPRREQAQIRQFLFVGLLSSKFNLAASSDGPHLFEKMGTNPEDGILSGTWRRPYTEGHESNSGKTELTSIKKPFLRLHFPPQHIGKPT